MSRPKKDNADYFSHDNNMRNDPKIKALRRKYGNEGYAIWNMLLEVLTESESFNIKIGKIHIELLSGDFECEPELLYDLIDYAVTIELLSKDGENIFSSSLKKRLLPVIQKREAAREREMERREFLSQKKQTTIVSVTETTTEPEFLSQKNTKVKESKVNKKKSIKEKAYAFTPPHLFEVKEFFIKNGYSEKSAIRAFEYYNSGGWKDGRGNQVKNWKQKMIAVWFKDENEIPKQQKMVQSSIPM